MPKVCGYESKMVEAEDAWDEAGRSLLKHDPEKFQQILSITRAFVALFERGVEDAAVFASRMAQITSKRSKVTS